MEFLVFCAAIFFVDSAVGCNSFPRLQSSKKVSKFDYLPRRSLKRSSFSQTRRGPLIWEDEFDHLDVIDFFSFITRITGIIINCQKVQQMDAHDQRLAWKQLVPNLCQPQ